MLQALLQAGLLCKAEQANLAISLTRQNASQVRAALGMHVGKQGFGKKLDEDGWQRSAQIASAQKQATRLKCRGELDKAEAKLQEIESLKREHQLLNACRENQQLHEYMRELRSFEGMLGPESSNCKRSGEPHLLQVAAQVCGSRPGSMSLRRADPRIEPPGLSKLQPRLSLNP